LRKTATNSLIKVI